jgi:hypothetical protein
MSRLTVPPNLIGTPGSDTIQAGSVAKSRDKSKKE